MEARREFPPGGTRPRGEARASPGASQPAPRPRGAEWKRGASKALGHLRTRELGGTGKVRGHRAGGGPGRDEDAHAAAGARQGPPGLATC